MQLRPPRKVVLGAAFCSSATAAVVPGKLFCLSNPASSTSAAPVPRPVLNKNEPQVKCSGAVSEGSCARCVKLRKVCVFNDKLKPGPVGDGGATSTAATSTAPRRNGSGRKKSSEQNLGGSSGTAKSGRSKKASGDKRSARNATASSSLLASVDGPGSPGIGHGGMLLPVCGVAGDDPNDVLDTSFELFPELLTADMELKFELGDEKEDEKEHRSER